MILRVEIHTPTGKAQQTGERLKGWLVGDHLLGSMIRKGMLRKRLTLESWASPEDDTLYWEIDCEAKDYVRICRNIYRYDWVVKQMFGNKQLQKLIDSTPEQQEQLRRLLEQETKITIMKNATAEEIQEGGESLWTRIKKTYKQQNPTH